MPLQILATKLYIPPPPPGVVPRARLVDRLDDGLHRKLTLISAPAGFGKTTLLSAWVTRCDGPVAWLSLDDDDNDAARFLLHLVAALRTIAPSVGDGAMAALQSSRPPPTDAILIPLLNELTTNADGLVLVFDDYHVIDAPPVDTAVTFLLEHLPPRMRLVIATREDPQLPLARLRGSGQLSELRVADLRFSLAEAAAFLNQAMGLNLSSADVAALEARTEGWIAGLQLAALSLQGRPDSAAFIASFSGSHHFVLDYLLAEVLERQSEIVQTFLSRTSILDRLCGALCDAVLREPAGAGQAMLEYLARANLFLVPLDDERRWYRYHHLFAELLRQRLQQESPPERGELAELHARASQWYEDQGLEVEAFHHAAAANDVQRAERLIDGSGVPLQFRGLGAPVLAWLESLPAEVLNARPALWVTYATALLFVGRHTAVEAKLQAAEAVLRGVEPDDRLADLVGRIASVRATLAIMHGDADTIVAQSRRALEYLRPDNAPIRAAASYTLGYAQQLRGERAAASAAYAGVITLSTSFGGSIYTTAATLGLGQVQEADNQLPLATQTYQRVLRLIGDPPSGLASQAHLGLARICYEWNDLDAAEEHAHQCLELTRQGDSVDTFASYAVLSARLRLARGDVPGADAVLDEADEFVRQHRFEFRMPDLAGARVRTLLQRGDLAAAARLAGAYDLPLSQARAHLAAGDPAAALAVLEPWGRQVEAKSWADERLRVMVLRALAFRAHGDTDRAVELLIDALALGERGGFIRSFVDEGVPMAGLLALAAASARNPAYVENLRAACEPPRRGERADLAGAQPPIDPLSQRELEVLRLIAEGLSNHDIGERLVLALDTVKGHNRKIFGKLQVQRRTEAVARARELGLV